MQKSAIASLGLLVASLLVTAILVEGALRLAGIGYPLFTQADHWTGFTLRPGAAGYVREEGDAFVRINRFGMRDADRSAEKPPRTVRIAVLGDSYTEARQVDREEAYPALLERELASCPALDGQAVEVLNFGVSGFGTAQELLHMRHKVLRFDPDVILLGFTTGNDIRNNSFALEGSRDKPYFHLEGSGLVLDLSFRESPAITRQLSAQSQIAQWALSRSRILQVAYRAKRNLAAKNNASAPASSGATIGPEAGLDSEIYHEPHTPEWREAWATTEQLLMMMRDEAAQSGARFAVVTLSNGVQVHPDPTVRSQFEQSLGVEDLFYPDRRIAAAGERSGIPVLALAPVLQKEATDRKKLFHGFERTGFGGGHWNEEGHAAAGTHIAAFLCDKDLLAGAVTEASAGATMPQS